ncbi:MAG: aldolase [Nautilia sp.]|nr:MAG: aldolase [Nautilia sp.]
MNYLMVSAHNKKHLSKIEQINAIIMLNLEDGVPKDKKEEALQNIIKLLKKGTTKKIVVRTNSIYETGLKEIEILNQFNIAFRIPKINSVEELEEIFKITSNEIHLSVETKEMFFNLKEFKYPQIKAFYLGILDLFDELNLSHSLINPQNQLVHKILIDFSLNSRYLGITPIGFVYQKYKDLEGFREWSEIQKNYGFSGIGCITPAQIEIANEIFKNEDLEYAKMIVEKFEKEGPFVIDGVFVDEPIYKNYKNLINKI